VVALMSATLTLVSVVIVAAMMIVATMKTINTMMMEVIVTMTINIVHEREDFHFTHSFFLQNFP
jgi:hypothetical protein